MMPDLTSRQMDSGNRAPKTPTLTLKSSTRLQKFD